MEINEMLRDEYRPRNNGKFIVQLPAEGGTEQFELY